jgi:hypothetical protein
VKRRMRQHAIVLVDIERDQAPHGRDAIEGVQEEPLVFI